MATLNAILQRVGELVDPSFYAATSTGLTGTTLTDTKLITEAGMSRFLGGWVTRTALDTADRHRYIPAYASATGVASSLATYSNTSPTTVALLWWARFDPVDTEAAINRALENLYVEETFDGLTLVANQLQYPLVTDLAWVTEPGQVKAVFRRSGDTANQYRENGIAITPQVYADEDAIILDFAGSGYTPSSASEVVRIVTNRPYSTIGTHPIVTGAGTTKCPLELVAWKAAYYLLERALAGAALEGRDALMAEQERARVRVSEEQMKHPATRIQQSVFSPARGGGGWALSSMAWRR